MTQSNCHIMSLSEDVDHMFENLSKEVFKFHLYSCSTLIFLISNRFISKLLLDGKLLRAFRAQPFFTKQQ